MSTSSRFLQRSALLNILFAVEGGSMFFLDVALAAALGVGARSDSLYAAWSLPLTIGRGAFTSLTNSLIGLFAEAEDDRAAYSQSLTVIGALAFAAALLMSLTSRWWFPLSVPGAAPETRLAGVPLAAILAWLIALLALAETQRAIYYRLGRNVFPSAVRVAGALAAIAIVLFSAAEQNLALAAYGLVTGAAVEMLLGFAGLLVMGQRFRLDWPPTPQLRRMAQVVGLPLMGQGVFIAGSTLERAIASYLGPGAVTAVTYSNRIFQMLERFVFRGFVIATIQSYTAGHQPHWRRDTRILLLLSIPLMIVFAVLPTAIITIIFERGRFTAEATQLVSLALRAYAFAIPIVAFNRIPFALAFAQNKSRELLLYSCIFAASLVLAELGLTVLGVGIPAFGIAQILANVIATSWLYRRIMRGLDTPRWSRDEIARLVGVALLAFVLTGLLVFIIERLIPLPGAVWITFIAGGAGTVLFTWGAARLLRLPETERLAHLLRGAWR